MGGWAPILLLGPGLGLACAAKPVPEIRFEFFAEAYSGEDPWFEKVGEWQRRARERGSASDEVFDNPGIPRSGLLSNKLGEFSSEEKRRLARRINEWSQIQARKHYRKEPNDDFDTDHWPTFGELLSKNGDDCDGLDLMAYELLREFGYGSDGVYRAIVRRDRDRANHMITLWFEDPADPWVLDATGAMSLGMRRFSELPGWTPTKVFSETEQFRAIERTDSALALATDSP